MVRMLKSFGQSLPCSNTEITATISRIILFAAGKWTVQQAAELAVAAPTIEAALDGRFMSGLKEDRVAAAAFYEKYGVTAPKTPEVSQCPNVLCN